MIKARKKQQNTTKAQVIPRQEVTFQATPIGASKILYWLKYQYQKVHKGSIHVNDLRLLKQFLLCEKESPDRTKY